MSYDRSFSSRGRGGRGRGGFIESGSSRPYTKYEDRSPKNDFIDGSRRAPIGGQYSRGYERDDRREPRDNVEVYKPRREEWRGGREYGGSRRSPVEYRRDIVRGRPLSPPRKEYVDLRPPRREYAAPPRVFDARRSDGRRDYSPIPQRERRMSPVRYVHDRYESPRRNFERESFTERRRNDFRPPIVRDYRDDRSRSPNMRVRGGGNRFNGQRGGRGRDNYNRFESDQRSSFNKPREDFSIKRGRFNENQKRKIEPSLGSGIVAKKSRDSSLDNSP